MKIILDEQVLNTWRLIADNNWIFRSVGLELAIAKTKQYCYENNIKKFQIFYLNGKKKIINL